MNKAELMQPEIPDFYLPFGGKLNPKNRWVKLAAMLPWDEVEACYQESLTGSGMGAPPLSARIAYGALVIKERLGITDEETAEQIGENPYLQYFLGLSEMLKDEPLFDASMMVHFRARFKEEHHQRINARIIAAATGNEEAENNDDQEPPANKGKLLLDATCVPADIKYPTDLGLLNEAREKSEAVIDQFHNILTSRAGQSLRKPRTYRQQARKKYLAVAKQKQPGAKKIRKAIGQQLNYLKRNLGHIARISREHPDLLASLTRYDYKCLLVIHTLYDQQRLRHSERMHSVDDRIVSISQPHVRPIVRGKAGCKVEFGAKVAISHQQGGYVSLDTLSWDAYNESGDLIGAVETYRQRYGYYPASLHVDTIYRTRANRSYAKARGIRISGKPLGRPKKATQDNRAQLKAEKIQQREDERDRIPVEGKFGNTKRKGTLNRIMAKLPITSLSVIHVGIVVLNLDKWLAQVLLRVLNQLAGFRLSPVLGAKHCPAA